MYLSEKSQRWISRGCFITALVLAGLGLYLSLKKPQFTDFQKQQQVYKAGQAGQVVIDPPSNTSLYLGLLLILGSVGVSALGAATADPNPKTLKPPVYQGQDVPPALPPAKDTNADPDSPVTLEILPHWKKEQVLQNVQQQLLMLLTQNTWLQSLMKCYSVVIIGGQGSGKSTLASNLILFRRLLFGWDAIILDPHADQNLKREIWTFGKVYGSSLYSELSAAQQIVQYGHSVYDAQKVHESIVNDEFSAWSVEKGSPLDAFAQHVMLASSQNNRKFLRHAITLVHGDGQGNIGGEHTSADLYRRFMDTSAVIVLQMESDVWGDGQYTGKALFKPAFEEYCDRNLQPVQIPPALFPGKLHEALGDLMQYLNIKLDPEPCGPHSNQPKPTPSKSEESEKPEKPAPEPKKLEKPDRIQILNELYESTDSLPDRKLSEEGGVALPSRKPSSSPDTPDKTSERRPIRWQSLGSRYDLTLQFLTYVFERAESEPDGSYQVRLLQQTWGAKQGLDEQIFQSFLGLLNSLGVGTYTSQQPLLWKPLIAAADVPKS